MCVLMTQSFILFVSGKVIDLFKDNLLSDLPLLIREFHVVLRNSHKSFHIQVDVLSLHLGDNLITQDL